MVLTKKIKKRMKIQGWVFDKILLEEGIFEELYRHAHHPGVYFITQKYIPRGYELFSSDAHYQKEKNKKR